VEQDGSRRFDVLVYLDGATVRGSLPALGFNRLTDALNSREGEYLTLDAAQAVVGSIGEQSWQAAEIQLARHSILLIEPLQAPGQTDPESAVAKLPTRATMLVGSLVVTGWVHLLGRTRMVDFLTATHERFFPVTAATVRGREGPPSSAPFLLVNCLRVAAFSPLDGEAA
jgi:hypothetical protein